MLHPSTQKLIDRLAEMTELGKLDWTEGENGSLVYSTEGYSVCLPDGAKEVVIQSKDGKELERAAADTLASTMTDQGVSYAQIVADMGKEANRYARGTETAISSLLAGMEEPQDTLEEDVAALADDGPEDPGDESAALASEGIANHELTPAPEAEPEPAPETESIVDADEAEAEIAAPVSTTEESSFGSAESADSETEEPTEAETAAEDTAPVAESAADSDEGAAEIGASEPAEDEIDTESDVTEAVARLADEVNNRPDAAPNEAEDSAESEEALSEAAPTEASPADETPSDADIVEAAPAEDEAPSTIGLAAATAMGVVASAAGLGQEESDEQETVDAAAEPETTDAAAAETAETVQEDAPVEETISASPASEPYVPFGLVAGSEAPASALATEMIDEAAPAETPVTTFDAQEPQTEQVDSADAPEAEFEETVAPDSSLAFGEEAAEQPVEAAFETTVEDVADAPEATDFVMSEEIVAESAPATEDTSAEDTVDLASTETDPVVESMADAASTEAPPFEETSSEAGETEGGAVDSEPDEPEPVLAAPEATEAPSAAPEAPRTYSLSGIGAGFGLGALSAKTEASGIPGPSSIPQSEPEKIIIDATEDVLPEIEGNLDLEKMEAAVSEINFGNKDASQEAQDSESEDDPDGDILKPRTRFNPWD